MIRVSHVIACPIDFDLLCERGEQGGMLKTKKKDQFQVFSVVRVLFLMFWVRLMGGI